MYFKVLNPIATEWFLSPKRARKLAYKNRAILSVVDGQQCIQYTEEYFEGRRRNLLTQTGESHFNRAPVRKVGNAHGRMKRTRPTLRFTGSSAKELHWRESVLKRDNYRCIWCAATENLEADHIKPKAAFPHLIYDIANGRTLCKVCHRRRHGRAMIDISVSDLT